MVEIFGEIEEKLRADIISVYDEVARIFSLPKRVKVNLTLVSSQQIQTLNRDTRNIDRVTDVLTYPYIELKKSKKLRLADYQYDIDPDDKMLLIGDIYICTDRAKEQAAEYGHSFRREMCFLFCHGMLHIMGYDHMTPAEEEEMTSKQEEILNNLNITRQTFKAGFVSIIGETNVGKSSLINRLVGEHVAIVSPKTQTTRENIIGIYNDATTQIVFVDTPGYHKGKTKIDLEMDKHISESMKDVEIILMMISAQKPLVPQYEKLRKNVSSDAKKLLLINKIDETNFEHLYPELERLSQVADTDEILPISALKGQNLDVLLQLIKKYLPSYDREMRFYPETDYTDKTLRHMIAEIIREKALYLLDDEVPHGIYVVVNECKEGETPVQIQADMICEKSSHKAIILGKNGDMIKKISTMARKDIERLLEKKVNLRVFVKVKEGWRQDSKVIAEFGLDCQPDDDE